MKTAAEIQARAALKAHLLEVAILGIRIEAASRLRRYEPIIISFRFTLPPRTGDMRQMVDDIENARATR